MHSLLHVENTLCGECFNYHLKLHILYTIFVWLYTFTYNTIYTFISYGIPVLFHMVYNIYITYDITFILFLVRYYITIFGVI